MERLCKTTLFVDQLVLSGLRPPGKDEVRKYGHRLVELLSKVRALDANRGLGCYSEAIHCEILADILAFLDEFARSTGYSNLDALASGSTAVDVLAEWSDLLVSVLEQDVPRIVRKELSSDGDDYADSNRSVFVFAHDLLNRPLSVTGLWTQQKEVALANKLMIWHAVEILAPATAVLSELSSQAREINLTMDRSTMHIPEMSEFFTFTYPDYG